MDNENENRYRGTIVPGARFWVNGLTGLGSD
jgi:hypothetical protein